MPWTALSCPLTHPEVWSTSIRGKEWSEVVARIFPLLPVLIRVDTGSRSVTVPCCFLLSVVSVVLLSRRVVTCRLTNSVHTSGERRLLNSSMSPRFVPLVVRSLQTI